MEKIIVVGHKNPDTDSVVAAVMFAKLLKKEGKEAIPKVAGDINKETRFVFDSLKEEVPESIKSVNKEDNVFLVDHNELAQSVAERENVCGVLDHHALAGLKTDTSVYFRVEPLGSTCTLIYKLMKERGINPCTEEIDLLLAGIIADTLNLNSSTTTTEDVDSFYELSQVSKIDAESFAREMFEAKSDFSGESLKDVIGGDLKEYEAGGKKIGIGVCETASLKYFEEKKNEIKDSLKEVKEENGFDAFFFGVIDILNNNVHFYPGGSEEEKLVEEKFEGEKKDDFFLLKDTSSRKKELAPPILEFYNVK